MADVGHLLEESAGFLEGEARAAGKEAGVVSVAEVAEEVGADVGEREKLLVAVGAFLSRAEEFGIDFGVVEAGHGSAVESEGAGGEDEVGSLEAGVSVGCGVSQFGRVLKHLLEVWRVRKELGQLREEVEVGADDGSDRGGEHLVDIEWGEGGDEPLLGLRGAQKKNAGGTAVGAGGAPLQQIVEAAEGVVGDGLGKPERMSSG